MLSLIPTTPDFELVPNEHPVIPAPYRIAIIGEAPGKDEVEEHRPFVGASGRYLFFVMSKASIARQACFIGNISQHRPPNNDITAFSWDGTEIQSGLEQLRKDLQQFKPNICVLLGNTPLYAATHDRSKHVTDWRGSLFKCTDPSSPFYGYKCLPALHPAAVLRNYEWAPLLLFDLHRARSEGNVAELVLPERRLHIDLSLDDICQRLRQIRETHSTYSTDIEGGINSLSCIAFATSPNEAFTVPLINPDGSPKWTEDEEMRLWVELSLTLSDPTCIKILQNYLYDAFVLFWSYKILIRGPIEDTMVMHWELFSELEKSLALQTSIYTKEPYYKGERKTQDWRTFLLYNCKDAAVTFECWNAMRRQLTKPGEWHYRFNVALLAPFLYMELNGLAFDKERANRTAKQCRNKSFVLQWYLNKLSGAILPQNHTEWIAHVAQLCCFKKYSYATVEDLIAHPKKEYSVSIYRIGELLKSKLRPRELGELCQLVEAGYNVDSPPQMCDLLYSNLKFPPQYKKEKGRLTTKLTADALALLHLVKDVEIPPFGHPLYDLRQRQRRILFTILRLRANMTALESLTKPTDPDGRVRCGYVNPGSETGRTACHTSPTGSGFNLQTVTRKHRPNFPADPGDDFAGCDLSGADGWTVAAWCAYLGDRTMLDDYLSGLKPAKIIALMYNHGPTINLKTRAELKILSKSITSDGWLYFSCKRTFHGTDYGERETTISDTILKDCYKMDGTITYVPPQKTKQLQLYTLARYQGIQRWHANLQQRVQHNGYIDSASGHRRIVFGRRDDANTIRALLSNEPQENTTYATNLALLRCWTDPQNRRDDNTLTIRPVHQVHDALYVQWPSADREVCRRRLASYFNNVITIANQQIVIPFEGHWGRAWEDWQGDV